jgi:hypothetical protein
MLVPRLGVRPLLTVGLMLQAVSLAWMAMIIVPGIDYPDVVPAFVMAGVGMGLTFAPSASAVLADMATDDHATASSVNATVREMGIAIGVALLTAVFLGAGGSLTPAGYAEGLRPALIVGALSVGFAVLASLFVPARTGKTPELVAAG